MKINTKQILSFVVSCVLICSGFHGVVAQKSDRLDKAKNLLASLNIVDDDTNSIVTRERFADIFVRANNIYQEGYSGKNPFSDTDDSEYTESIEILRDQGFVNGVGNNCFAPQDNILTKDIARLYISALGFDVYAQATGMDYMKIAHEVKLFDGVVVSDYISMDNLILMTYNFLKAPVGVNDFGTEITYAIDYETDALYEKFDVIQVAGQVTQNDLTGIWSTDEADDGCVVIKTNDGEITAFVGESDIDMMIGHTLDIYLYENKDEYEVVCYEERANEQSVVIDIRNIDFDSTDNSRISYVQEGKSNVTIEKLASFPAFIINGVYYDAGQFDIGVLSNYSGQIKLIATERSAYDIVIIDAYTNYFVKNVEHYNGEMRIYDSGTNEALVLNDTVYKRMELFYPNGAKASPFEIQAGMLLTVAKSFDRENYIKILISDTVSEGVISGYDAEDRVLKLDNGQKYQVSASYNVVNMSLGALVRLYIDKFGDVAWVEYDKTAVYSYAFMKKPRIDDDGERVIVKVVTESGKFTNMYLAEKTTIDAVAYKHPQAQLSELETVEKIANLVAGEYPFRYRLNKDGEIREIDTPRVRTGHEEKYSFRVTASGADVICSNDKILGKQTPLSGNSVVFLIPEATATEERENPKFYSVGNSSLLNTGGSNTYTAFQVSNDSLYVDLVVRTQTNIGGGLNHDNVLFLVEDIQEIYDDKSDEIRVQVCGLEGGTRKEYLLHDQFDKTKLDGIGRGDVLRFSFYGGEITAVDKVFIYNDDTTTDTGKYHLPTGGQKASSLSQIGTSYYYAGYVIKREGRLVEILPFDLSAGSQDAGILVPNIPDWSIETRRVFQAPSKISVYDPSLGKKGSIYSGDLEDIPAYEDGGSFVKVIVRYRSRSAQEMIVLKDESLFR